MYQHKKEYEVRFTDVDFADRIKLSSLLSFLEESACLSADELGFGYADLQPKGLGFVITNWQVESYDKISLGDVLTVYTWPVEPKKIIVLRDFEFYVRGKKVGAATSRWGLVDLNNFSVLPNSIVLGDNPIYNSARAVNNINYKIPVAEKFDFSYSRFATYTDCDHYMHVNNVKYADFFMDAFTIDDLKHNYILGAKISYLKQCKCGEKLDVYKTVANDKSIIMECKVGGETRAQAQIFFYD